MAGIGIARMPKDSVQKNQMKSENQKLFKKNI